MFEPEKLLTTKQLPDVTGYSESYFEKGRMLGYGPRYIRPPGNGKSGKILYRLPDVLEWLKSHEISPEGADHD